MPRQSGFAITQGMSCKVIFVQIFTLILSWSLTSVGSENKMDILKQAVKTYREAKMIEMTVEKRMSSDWNPKEKLSIGKLFYSQGKIRFEFETPEKEWDLYDGKSFWIVNFPGADFPGGKNKVLEDKNASKHKDQVFLVELLESKNPSDSFEAKESKNTDDVLDLILKPKKETPFKEIHVIINQKTKSFSEINYRDDMNTIRYVLGKPSVKEDFKKGFFSYKPDPKKDDVTPL